MRFATPCPGCDSPITLGRVMVSGTPLHLSCPACKRRIRVEKLTLPTLAVGVLAGLGIAKWLGPSGGGSSAAIVVRVLLAIVFVELVASLLVVNWGKLSLRGSGRSE